MEEFEQKRFKLWIRFCKEVGLFLPKHTNHLIELKEILNKHISEWFWLYAIQSRFVLVSIERKEKICLDYIWLTKYLSSGVFFKNSAEIDTYEKSLETDIDALKDYNIIADKLYGFENGFFYKKLSLYYYDKQHAKDFH